MRPSLIYKFKGMNNQNEAEGSIRIKPDRGQKHGRSKNILRTSLNKGLSPDRNSVIASFCNEPSRTGDRKSCPGGGSCHMQLLQGKSLYHQDGY